MGVLRGNGIFMCGAVVILLRVGENAVERDWFSDYARDWEERMY